MNKMLFSLFSIMLFSVVAIGQKTITGTVQDIEGEPLVGVNVLIKELPNVGALTDLDGNYSIQVNEGQTLVFSYIGYKSQEILVGSGNTINIELMLEAELIDEVVITGYSSIKRSDMVTAHTSLDAEDLNRTVNQTIEQALQGRAAGVQVTQNTGQPGGGITVNVRGISTINGNTQPLYVVDGVQMQVDQVEFGSQSASNPLAGLNPSDIESMEVLTGPVATSLYGSRATNGVIVITTKSGKTGDMNIKYDYTISQQSQPSFLDMMNLNEYASYAKEYYDIEGGTLPGYFEDPSLLGEGTNWQNELFNEATMQKHNLSLSGGTKSAKYYLSGEYFDQEGVAIGSGFKRYSALLKVDNQLNDWLTVSSKINLSQTNTRLITGQENIISTALQMTPNIPVRNFDGSFSGGDVSDVGAQQFLPPNPIGLAEITNNDQLRRRALAGINFNVKLMDGLNFITSVNGDIQNMEGTYFQPEYKFGYQERTTGTLQERANSSNYYNFQQMLTYNNSFSGHTFNALALHEAQKSEWKNQTGSISEFESDQVVDLNLGNSETAIVNGGKGSWAQESYLGRLNYNFNERYYLMTTLRADGSSNFGSNNKWGYFPSASVAWRVSKEPFFNTSLISELRLRFETGLTGNQGGGGFIYGTLGTWTTPWGTGFALNRYSNPDLRWEETSTTNFGLDLAFLEGRFQLEMDYYVKETDELLTEAANPDYLGVTGSGGIGNPFVNVGSLRNKGWTMQLESRNLSSSSFSWSTNFNLSTVESKILSLNTSSGFYDRTSWWMDNWTQRSAVGQAPWLFYGYISDGLFESLEELEVAALPVDNNGNKLPVAEDGIWIGDVKYRDISGPEGEPDGIIDTYDQTYIGNPNAKYIMGLTNTFTYKEFDLSVLLTGAFDYDVYNYTAFNATRPNNVNLSRNFLNIAYNYARIDVDNNGDPVITNSGTNIPRINVDDLNGNYSRHSSRFVEDGSFIRIKNITLSYNLPANLTKKMGFVNAMRISLSAQNIYTFTDYTGYDPEIGAYTDRNVSAANQAIGVDNGRYPSVPLYTASIGVQF